MFVSPLQWSRECSESGLSHGKEVLAVIKSLASKEVAEALAREGGELLYAAAKLSRSFSALLLAAQVQAVEKVFRTRGYFDLRASCGDQAAWIAGKAHDPAEQLLVDLLAHILRLLLSIPAPQADAV